MQRKDFKMRRNLTKRKKAAALGLLLTLALTAPLTGCAGEISSPAAGTENTTAAETAAQETTAVDTAAQETTEQETAAAEAGDSAALNQVAGDGDKTETVEVVEEGMTPVYARELKEGIYPVTMESSSSMFKADHVELSVEDGGMQAILYMSSESYLYMYAGTAEEAAAAQEADYIALTETGEEYPAFTLPVEALDAGESYAAYGKRKEMWYDRTLLFRADSLPAEAFLESRMTAVEDLNLQDGVYTVEVRLEGGSGKASVESPAELRIADGAVTAIITWSSSNYDYMMVDGKRYDQLDQQGNSAFEIPVTGFDYNMPVQADTTAMSKPYLIDYTLHFDSATIVPAEEDVPAEVSAGKIPLQYAQEFSAVLREDGTYEITIGDDSFEVREPYGHIYAASSASMDLFDKAGAIEAVAATGTKAADWEIPAIREKVESGEIVFAGKYSAPDYEYLVADGCDLAVENTMIYHTPEVKEKLESLGIPVIVERSSYETEPLGRMEWIKLYGMLTGHYEEAAAFFDTKVEELRTEVENEPSDGISPTVVFFYINTKGQPVVRKPGDYISRMIELAGGTYFLTGSGEEENMLSTMNMQWEAFLQAARDADILIYNSSIDAEMFTVEELLAKDALLGEFRAVKEGNAWCTGKNMFQESSAIADMILEMQKIFGGSAGDGTGLSFIHKLQ